MNKQEETIKANFRVSKIMKEQLEQMAGGLDLCDYVELLVVQYNEAWQKKGFENMLIETIVYKTPRKKINDDRCKELTAKTETVSLITTPKIYAEYKEHCNELGISFGEGIRRLIKQQIKGI